MIKIAPSILSADFANLGRDILRIKDADYVHVDVMDGTFVPNITLGVPVIKCIRKVTDMPFDVHLMIDRPLRLIDDFCDAGADLITFHVEADTPENCMATLNRIHEKGLKGGIALRPGTPAEAVLPYLDKCDIILSMTVEPGFGGQKFKEETMPKLRQIRAWIDERNPACELEVDGGIDPVTCKIVIENGANVLVAGSSVYKAEDISKRIAELRG